MSGAPFHSWTPLLRREGIIYVAEGVRETGKSYPMLLRMMKRAIRNHRSGVWLRRTEEEVKAWLNTFGSAKWTKIARQAGLDPEKLVRRGNRIFYDLGDKKNPDLRPVLRAGALSGWGDFRDTDDPVEELIYLDEGYATIEKHRRYVGNEVEHGLDILKSLRRGDGADLRMVIAGNAERATNVWLDYFGIPAPRAREGSILPLTPAAHGGKYGVIWYEHIARRRTTDGLHDLLRGTAVGDFLDGTPKGARAGLIEPIPRKATLYVRVDFGRPLSIWLCGDRMIVSTRPASGACVRRELDGRADTVLLTPQVRRHFVLLRQYFQRGAIRFDSLEAQEWGLSAIEKLL